MVTVPGLGEVDGRTPLDALGVRLLYTLPHRSTCRLRYPRFSTSTARKAWPRLSVNHCGAEGSSDIRYIFSEHDLDRVVAFARWLAVAASFLDPV